MNPGNWMTKEIVEETINMKLILLKKFHLNPSVSDTERWATRPYAVLAMLVSGEGSITIATKEGRKVINELGSPFLLPANIQRMAETSSATGLDTLAIGYSIEVLGGIDFLNFFDLPITFSAKNGERLKELMLALLAIEEQPHEIDLKRILEKKRLLLDICEIIIEASTIKKEKSFVYSGKSDCLPAVQYLNKHYNSKPEMKKLHEMCNLSQAHFYRMFKKITGDTPFNYIKKQRIKKAQMLLITTTMSVFEIAQELGWSDPFHFSRIYKAETGLSPMKYRKKINKHLL